MFEYVVKKPDYKVKIMVDITSSFGGHPEFVIRDVQTLAKGKRKYNSIANFERDSFHYRHTEVEKRGEYIKGVFLKYCSEEDIDAAIEYVISQLKPTRDEIKYRIY